MGCAQSKVDNEESVSRCKDMRNLMKEVVSVRNAFASAYSGYSVSLKNTGAALSDYAVGEVPPAAVLNGGPSGSKQALPPAPQPPPHPMVDPSFPLPPPPLPSFSPTPPLKRAVTMPAGLSKTEKLKVIGVDESDVYGEEEEGEEGNFLKRQKEVEEVGPKTTVQTPNQQTPPEIRGMGWDFFFADNMPQSSLRDVEDEGAGYMGGDGNLNNDGGNAEVNSPEKQAGSEEIENFNNVGGNVEFKTPEKEKQVELQEIEEFKTPEEMPASVQFMHSNTAPLGMSEGIGQRKVEGNKNGVDFLKILSQIDDLFLKASEDAKKVSKMLETNRMHYHYNFADNRGDQIILQFENIYMIDLFL